MSSIYNKSITIPPEYHATLHKLAQRRGVPMSELATLALHTFLEQARDAEPPKPRAKAEHPWKQQNRAWLAENNAKREGATE